MPEEKEVRGIQLVDFEQALRALTDQLVILYRNIGNPDDAIAKTVIQLLANASRLSPYIEELLENLSDESYNRLARPLELAVEIGNKKEDKKDE